MGTTPSFASLGTMIGVAKAPCGITIRAAAQDGTAWTSLCAVISEAKNIRATALRMDTPPPAGIIQPPRPLHLALDRWLHELGLQEFGLSIRLVKVSNLAPNSCGMSNFDVQSLIGEIDLLPSDKYTKLPACLDGDRGQEAQAAAGQGADVDAKNSCVLRSTVGGHEAKWLYGKLKRIDATGGPAISLAATPTSPPMPGRTGSATLGDDVSDQRR